MCSVFCSSISSKSISFQKEEEEEKKNKITPTSSCSCLKKIPSWQVFSPLQWMLFHPPSPSTYESSDSGIYKLKPGIKKNKSSNSSSSIVKIRSPIYYFYLSNTDPVLFPENRNRIFTSKRLYFFFHGNSCDIGTMKSFLGLFMEIHNYKYSYIETHVVAMEYSGYGCLKDSYFDIKRMCESSEDLLSYFLYNKIPSLEPRDVFIVGQSIGTGIATYLTCHFSQTLEKEDKKEKQLGGMILISPFTSLKELISELVPPTWNWITKICYERFNNSDHVKQISIPSLFIHGEKDTLIPSSHSTKLSALSPSRNRQLIVKPKTNHNNFKAGELTDHILEFVHDFHKNY